MSDATTEGIRIEVASLYIRERSDPEADVYFFAYRVRITNVGEAPAQLMTRHWVITDANGHEEEVRGPGVVGETPLLAPGQRFEYTSACPLPTAVGTMHGSYEMLREDGTTFDAEIAPFLLAVPGAVN